MKSQALPLNGLLAALADCCLAAAAPTTAMAKAPLIYTAPLSSLAVQGYDPVSYFTDCKPVKGDARCLGGEGSPPAISLRRFARTGTESSLLAPALLKIPFE